jgi:hypothetical protein
VYIFSNMFLRTLHNQIVSLFLVLILALLSITPTVPANPHGINHLSTIHDGKGSRGWSEQVGGRLRRYEIPQNKFIVFFEVLPSEKPLSNSIYLNRVFSYDSSSSPTTARYYYPPPRDLPLASFHG